MGMSKGFPDLHIPLPTKTHYGAYIELKTVSGKLSREQRDWLDYLSAQGYYADVAYGFDDAKQKIEQYLANR